MLKPILFALLTLLSAVLAPAGASAQTTASSPAKLAAPTPAQAQQAIAVLQDPKERARLITTLEAIAAASPAPAAKAPVKAASPVPLAPDSLGAELVVDFARWGGDLSAAVAGTVRTVTDSPLLWHWLRHALEDPASRAALILGIGKLVLVAAGGLIVEALAAWALRRPRAIVAAHAPADAETDPDEAMALVPPRHVAALGAWALLRRLPFALARLGLELVPLAAFAVVANLLAGSALGAPPPTRLAILTLLGAYLLTRGILCFTRMLVAPGEPRLRLLHIGEAAAGFIVGATRRVVIVAVFGGALVQIARQLGLDDATHATLMRVLALVVAILLVIVVFESRQGVGACLRAPPGRRGGIAGLRNWLADSWHYLAIVAIVGGWVVWSSGVGNGVGGVVRFVVGTGIVLIAARLLAIVGLGMLDRALGVGEADPGGLARLDPHVERYSRPLRWLLVATITILSIIALLEVWGFDAFAWFHHGEVGGRLLSAALTIAIAAVAAIVVWEGANSAMDRHIDRLARESAAARAARLRTVLPILRTTLLVAILGIVALTTLSEIGINIAPLLAGAGIIGIAIGFGSQKLVQDVITGLFLLIENAIQVGDAVTVAGLSGTVEQLSIRTMWLRATEGAVHIIPFSSVTSITNTNRGIGNAAVTVTVAYKEDIERVGTLLREIVGTMRADPQLGLLMRGDLKLWGVDKVSTAGGVTLLGQIECTDAGRWPVQREFYRRLKERFATEEIDIVSAG